MDFDVVIGLEVHCQLNTSSKIFASDFNVFGSEPNTNIGVLTLAHPGVLPKINKNVVNSAVKLGLALGCEINKFNYFDRKNYFYPDLPKGYQVSQDSLPICKGGSVKFVTKNGKKFIDNEVLIHHIHMEEDAGKSVHENNATLLDFNRAGAPLLEIVSYPSITSPEQAAGYLAELRKIVRFLNISDGNMEEGSLRADLNVSLKPKGSSVLGTKVEIKNMNSIRFLQRAAEYEIKRQEAVLRAGGTVIQETRTFLPETGETMSMRVKETANDYRYFPEPDLAPIVIADTDIEEVKASLPELSFTLFYKFVNEFGVSEDNSVVIAEEKDLADYFQEACQYTEHAKAVSNWIVSNIRGYLNEKGETIKDFPVKGKKLADLVNAVEEGLISNSAAQKLLELLIVNPSEDVIRLAEANNLLQTNDVSSLSTWIETVLENNKAKVEEFKKGKKGLLGMFVGEVMKLSNGSADPKEVNKLLIEKLK